MSMLRSPLGAPVRPLARKVTEAGGGVTWRAALMRDVSFIGDSRVQTVIRSLFNASSSDWKGLSIAAGFCAHGITAAGSGLLEYRAADQHFRWTAPGDTAGPWTPGYAGRITFQSGSPDKSVLLGIRTLAGAPASDQSITITVSGFYRMWWWANGFADWAMIGLRWLQSNPKMLGISGSTSSQVVDQIAAMGNQAAGFGVDVILLGTNDINASTSAAAITANLQSIYDARRAIGRRLVLVNEPARWGAAVGTPMTAAQQSTHAAVNDFIASYAAAHGCVHIDAYALTVDGGFTDRRPVAGYLTDIVHFSDLGSQRVGLAVSDALAALGGTAPFRAASDSENRLALGVLSGTSGSKGSGVVGTVATGWSVTRNSGDYAVTAAVADRSDGGAGKWQEMTVSGGTVEGFCACALSSSPTLSGLGVSVGDYIYLECDVELVGPAGIQSVDVYAVFNGAAVAAEASSSARESASSRLSAFAGRLRTPVTRIPEGTTSINAMLRVQLATSVSGTVRYGAFSIVKVS